MDSTIILDQTTMTLVADSPAVNNSTFNASPEMQKALNSTFSPTTKTITRERQKTMVVESNMIKEIREAFAAAKVSGEEINLTQIEATVLYSVQRFENEMTKKIREAEVKHDSDIMIANGLIEQFYQNSEKLIDALETGKLGSGGNCDGSCASAAKMRLDLESAHNDLEDRYNEYIKLLDSFQKLRKATALQKEEYAKVEQIIQEERKKYQELKGKFQRLKESATSQLTMASNDVSRLEREHEEKTLGLRLRVKQLESANNLKDRELDIKKNEIDELRVIINTLMKEVQPMSDGDSERE